MKQTDIFGQVSDVTPKMSPDRLPHPINDWAVSLRILLNHPKGVTVFEAMSKYGMPKFQERLNEILKAHPSLVEKKMVTVRKRLNRKVDVMNYTLTEVEKAMEVYFEINKKGCSRLLKNQ